MSKTENLTELVNPSDKSVWHIADVVVMNNNSGDYLGKITRITSGRDGTIYVSANGSTSENAYDSYGHQRSSSTWTRGNIRLASTEDIAKIYGRIRKSKLNAFDMNQLSDEDAKNIIELLREKGYKI